MSTSKFYVSSSSSSSDSDADDEQLPITKAEAKKTIGFYVLQTRTAMNNRNAVDYAKLLHSLTILASKLKASKHYGEDLVVTCLRLCHQVQSLLESQDFPSDRHTRRKVLNAVQAKASLALTQKHGEMLESIRSLLRFKLLPQELYTESARTTLDDLERHLISNPLSPIPIELLNTFNLVSSQSLPATLTSMTDDCRVCSYHALTYNG